jgi:hypothetical protein
MVNNPLKRSAPDVKAAFSATLSANLPCTDAEAEKVIEALVSLTPANKIERVEMPGE